MSDVEASGFVDRVAARAVDVRVSRLLLSILAFPFYVLGVILGCLLVAVRLCYAAVLEGIADVKRRSAADAG